MAMQVFSEQKQCYKKAKMQFVYQAYQLPWATFIA
jgi:hypothetical protein